jgi:dsDNA-specific endonuclease/ATPase MutS2
VQVQLRHFTKALDKAISGHYKKLIVIHGVGNGRLKQEVRAILESEHMRFHDASYARYGFGATEVIIG